MKMICKRVLVCVLAVLLLITATACAPSFKEPSSYFDLPKKYNEDTDFPVNFLSTSEISVAPSEDGYFIFSGSVLSFFDKDALISTPVCNKPECLHSGINCPAYFQRSSSAMLQFYEGFLYLVANEYDANGNSSCWLYRINTSDCTREKMCQLPYFAGHGTYYMMHRGYLYIQAVYVTQDKDSVEQVTMISCERVALNELSEKSLKPEVLYEHETASYGLPFILGNHYFINYTERIGQRFQVVTKDINLDTLTICEPRMAEMQEDHYMHFERMYDRKVIATYVDPEAHVRGDRATVYYSYDPKKGTFEPFVTLPDRGEGVYDFYSWDGENHTAFYMDTSGTSAGYASTQEFRVLDDNFETMKRIDTDYLIFGFLPGDADFLFFSAIENNALEIYAIDKRGEELKIVKVFE